MIMTDAIGDIEANSGTSQLHSLFKDRKTSFVGTVVLLKKH